MQLRLLKHKDTETSFLTGNIIEVVYIVREKLYL